MHAGTAIYEIHACAQGQWQTVATFIDPNAAVAEAVRLRGSRRYIGIRVTEAFHDAVDKFTTRVIYRYTAARNRHGVTAAEPEAAAIHDRSPKQVPGAEPPMANASLTRQETKPASQSLEQFLPMRLSVAIVAALLVLMTISAA